MQQHYQPIGDLLQGVRTRWRRLVLARAFTRGALTAALVLAVALLVIRWLPPSPILIALVGISAGLSAFAILVAALLPVRRVPSDARLARFVEEQSGTLDERLVTAVDVVTARAPDARPVFAESMVRDAARAVSSLDPSAIVRPETLRRAGLQTAAAAALLIGVLVAGRPAFRQTYDATLLALVPGRVAIDVTPGDARIEAGTNLRIEARLVGSAAPVVPQLLRSGRENAGEWEGIEMALSPSGPFVLGLNGLTESFQYRVIAGAATSRTFTVSVVRAPRVARIDVDYTYPKAFGLAPRTEEDGGDIYAPAGTTVRLRVHADTAAASGRVLFGDSGEIALAPGGDSRTLTGELTVRVDSSYRVALADAQGLASRGDTEYFIRTMDDRPPEVHVVKPASDRRVTALEEVEIEAEAADDFGVASLELVYAVRGGKENVVPLRIPASQTTVSSAHMLYLEDLDVRPGDFVSYYVRARDVARGRRAAEVTSDIFFLEIKNFEEEFTLAQSQAAQGGGASNPQLDELVAAQKEVIVATWKLDRRSRTASAQSTQDVRAVARAESELKSRVDRMASSLRTSTMRDPRARPPVARGGQRGAQPGAAPGAGRGQAEPEEEPMTAASTAMGEAATRLNALKTAEAMTPEMEALNQLLKAQSDIRKREVQRQQAGGGSGSNRNVQDLSSLFDKELARHQETNYENRSSSANRQEEQAKAVDKIKDLARRQDELLQQQQDLAARRAQMSADDIKRELEKLTRDQNDLRQRAEEVAEQIARQSQSDQSSQPRSETQGRQQTPQGQPGQQSASSPSNPGSEQRQPGQRGQPGSSPPQPDSQERGGQQGQSGQQSGPPARRGESERRLRDVSDQMRASAGELRRQDPEQARARAERALEGLRELEQQMNSGSPEGRRRTMGDLQLEARQLADAERQLAAEGRRAAQGTGDRDALRRLAGEQERLADRLAGVGQRLRQQSAGAVSGGAATALQQAAGQASREIERQRLTERMQQSAQAMRGRAGDEGGSGRGEPKGGSSTQGMANGGARPVPDTPQAQEEIARAIDRVAEQMSAADRGRDPESQRLSGQVARAQELRDRLNEVTERLSELDRQAGDRAGGRQSGQSVGRSGDSSGNPSSGQSGQSGQGQGSSAGSGEEVERLRAEMQQQVNALRDLLGEARRDPGGQGRGGAGMTFDGQGMVLSAPGTEGFKQDFARWQELKRQATAALETIESSASQRLQAKESKDRLTVGADDRPPSEYQQQVDNYFKALASKKTP